MPNPFDQFDTAEANPFDQFDEPVQPQQVSGPDIGQIDESQFQQGGTRQDVLGISQPSIDTQQDSQPGIIERTGSLALKAGSNLPGSSIDLLNNIGVALMHPLDTAQALGEVAFGPLETAVTGDPAHREKFDAIKSFYADRYGSLDGLTKAIGEDPAGVMADMSSLLTGVGGLAKTAGTVARVEPLVQAGQKISTAGAMADPLNLAATGVGKALGGGVAEGMYSSAAKMGTTKGIPERRAAANKALDEGLMPTESGVKVLEGKKSELYDKLSTVIDTAAESGDLIPRDLLFKNLRQAVNKATHGPQSATVKKQIFNMMNQLRNEHPKNINPRTVQDIKVSFQQAVNDSAWGKTTPGIKDANKQIARSAREILEERYPEVKGINKELSEYKNLEKEIEKAAARISNRDPIGMTKMLFTIGGGAAAGTEGMLAGLAAGMLFDPRVQAKTAILLRKLKSKGIQRGAKGYAARETARQAGRMEEEANK